MKLKNVRLTNFRNYEKETFNFTSGVNVIVGSNGVGKTNILEAIYMSLLAKSFRAKDNEVIKVDEPGFHVLLKTEDKNFTIGYTNKPVVQKKNLIDGLEVTPSELIGTKPVVLFEPNDVKIIEDSPSYRRRFFDQILSQTNREYLKNLITYRRILKQRNSLLKNKNINKDHVFAWDVNLARSASQIVKERLNLLDYINDNFSEYYQELAGSKLSIQGEYDSKIKSDDYASAMMKDLSRLLDIDHRRGYTSIGPHRDDILFLVDEDTELALKASRGEMRTSVLALKIIEAKFLKEKTDQEPLILLDDVFSELDEQRQSLILRNFTDFQTIITTTSLKDVSVKDANVIRL